MFTDLDGTLLDEDYRYEEALPALERLVSEGVPVIFSSAKTMAEQHALREEMGIEDPAIVEDGSAIYLPSGYFPEREGEKIDGMEVVVLGTSYDRITERIREISRGHHIRSYCLMDDREVAEVTGLPLEDARKAKHRRFSETVVEADREALDLLRRDFNVVPGGRFIQVFGRGADKGKAVRLLTEMYREHRGEVTTVGLGNSANDAPMLRAVDIPVLVRNPDGGWADLDIPGIRKESGVGPRGWSDALNRIVLGR